MMRVQVTGYHIFVIYLGLGLVVCLVGKDLNSQVQWMSIFPIPFTSKVIKYIQVTLTLGHNSTSKYWLLTPFKNSHVGHTHTRPQLRKQILIIDSFWEFPCCSHIYIREIIQIMFCIIFLFSFFFFLFLNSEKMLKCHHQFYYKKNYSKMFTN